MLLSKYFGQLRASSGQASFLDFDQLSCISSVSSTDRYLRDLVNQFSDHGSLRYTVINLGVDSLGEFARQAQVQQNRDDNDILQLSCTVILVCLICLDAVEV